MIYHRTEKNKAKQESLLSTAPSHLLWCFLSNKLSSKQWISCHGNKAFIRSFYVSMFFVFFSLVCFSLIPFGLTIQASVPPQTHKTNPCSYDFVICFSFVIVGLFLSLPTTNKHREWEKRRDSFFYNLHKSQPILSFPLYFLLLPLLSSLSLSLEIVQFPGDNDLSQCVNMKAETPINKIRLSEARLKSCKAVSLQLNMVQLYDTSPCSLYWSLSLHSNSHSRFPHRAIYHYLQVPNSVTWLAAFFTAILGANVVLLYLFGLHYITPVSAEFKCNI